MIFDYFHNPVVISDWAGKIVYANHAFLTLWGYSRIGQVIGISVLSLWKDKSNAQQAYDMVKQQGTWQGLLGAFTNADKELAIDATLSLFYRKGHKKGYFLSSFQDITEMINLRSRNIFLSSHSFDWFFECDTKGYFRYVSQSAITFTGYHPGTLIGKHLVSIIHQQSRKEISVLIQKLKEQQSSGHEEIEVVIETQQIPQRETLIRFAAQIDIMGVYKGIRGICKDVSVYRKFEHDLKEKEQKIDELNTALQVVLEKQQEFIHKKQLDLSTALYSNLTPNREIKSESPDSTWGGKDAIAETQTATPLALLKQFTHREIQIIDFILKGKTSKEIASTLSLTLRTVQFHREQIREKLGIKNRKENLRERLLELFYQD